MSGFIRIGSSFHTRSAPRPMFRYAVAVLPDGRLLAAMVGFSTLDVVLGSVGGSIDDQAESRR